MHVLTACGGRTHRRRNARVSRASPYSYQAAPRFALDEHAIAVGPFARLDANAVTARDDKTRGAITNLFGSQAAFQAETMARALSAGDWIERIEHPDPAAYDNADEWVDALFAGESERGPHHDAEPAVSYAFLWALWLSAVPYGLWSERISAPSMDEHVQFVRRLEAAFANALGRVPHWSHDHDPGSRSADRRARLLATWRRAVGRGADDPRQRARVRARAADPARGGLVRGGPAAA
jgi:hypothetical protein